MGPPQGEPVEWRVQYRSRTPTTPRSACSATSTSVACNRARACSPSVWWAKNCSAMCRVNPSRPERRPIRNAVPTTPVRIPSRTSSSRLRRVPHRRGSRRQSHRPGLDTTVRTRRSRRHRRRHPRRTRLPRRPGVRHTRRGRHRRRHPAPAPGTTRHRRRHSRNRHTTQRTRRRSTTAYRRGRMNFPGTPGARGIQPRTGVQADLTPVSWKTLNTGQRSSTQSAAPLLLPRDAQLSPPWATV